MLTLLAIRVSRRVGLVFGTPQFHPQVVERLGDRKHEVSVAGRGGPAPAEHFHLAGAGVNIDRSNSCWRLGSTPEEQQVAAAAVRADRGKARPAYAVGLVADRQDVPGKQRPRSAFQAWTSFDTLAT